MRKVNLLLFLFSMLGLSIKAQTFYLHAEYRTDWYNGAYAILTDIVGYPSVTLQAQTQADQFVIENSLGANRWRKFGTATVNVPAPYVFYPNNPGIGDNYLTDSTTIGHYYTTRFKDLGNSSTNGVVLETSGAPTNISSATQTPIATAVPANAAVTVAVTLGAAKNPEELFFIRYTNNGWATSAALPVTFSNAISGTATIPAQLANTAVSYYVMSSTVDVSSYTPTSDYDLVTLKLNNNGGVNYSYTTGTSAITTAPITFKVNMNGTTLGSGVFLAGSFNNFSATANPMAQIGTTGIYQTTVNIDTTATVTYKFVNGTTYETVPTTCSVNDGQGNFNRSLVVPNAATTLATVCYNLCDNSCQPAVVTTAPITFMVNMSTSTVGAGVFLSGSFNNFSTTANPMTQIGTTSVYQTTVNIDTTATVTYKFVNGTTYETIPQSCGVSGGFGQFNRSLVVPNAATTLATVCFGSCSNCPVPFLDATTFKVNMNGTTIGAGGVHIAGTFNGFSRTANAMTQVGTTGVYETTLQLDTTATHYYKFLSDTTNASWELIPAACGFTYSNVLNRKIVVPNTATTLATVCYNLCDNSCQPVVVTTAPITFKVNMNGTTLGSGVFLAGSFNSFSATANPMAQIGTTGVYQTTVNIDTTATVTYKFVNGTTFESVTSACGVSDGFIGFNRSLVVPNIATTLATVCYNLCDNSCQPAVVTTAPITFKVNMNGTTLGAGVFLAGSFNSFSATANPMAQIGTTGVYQTTVNIDTTATVTYKFVNGTTFETVPTTCSVNDGQGNFNRSLVVPNTATTLATVCYSECSDCSTVVVMEINKDEIGVYPNPTASSINITNCKGSKAIIFDINGRELQQVNITNSVEKVDLSTLAKGIYFIRINSNNQNKTIKLVKE